MRLYGKIGDQIFVWILVILGLGVLGAALLTGGVLLMGGLESFRAFGFFGFLVDTSWNPVRESFGAWPFILGTLITSLLALGLAFFPALATAIFAVEYAPRWASAIIGYFVDLLAALPSVVYGLWGILVLVPLVRDHFELPVFLWAAQNAPWLTGFLGSPTGIGLFSSILVLALMIVPFAASLARDAIGVVPREQREAAYALGATHWEVIRLAVIPYARGGIFAGVVLALARALGETMAVTMLIGNSHNLPYSAFGPAATMASVVANEFAEATVDLHYASLLAIGFVLFILSLLVNLLAAWVQRRMTLAGSRI